jgi:hypothetical protein
MSLPAGREENPQKPDSTLKGIPMNKLLGALLASLFAVSTAFAASHAGAPMAGASGAKKEAPKAEKAADPKKEAAKKDPAMKDAKKDDKKS